ncbi:uncharacterized protein LOC104864528 [Fukomys damarensis]|nr:uncharacterized protein LOC104864528 [Fukomys damarensis]
MLTHIGNTCCSWKVIIFSLRRRIRDLLSRDGPGSREGQSHRDHAEGHKLAEPLALQPRPEPGSRRTAASPSILTGRRGGSGRRVRFLTASAEELNLDASLGLKTPPKAEGDALQDSDDATCGIRAHGLPDAAAVLRRTVMEGKPRFRQWKMACRFPGAQA